jgi:UDP-N-acetylmuramyl tripeptide synthase
MSGSRVTVATPEGELELWIPLPGLYNVYNALAATACCISLGLTRDQVRDGIASFATAFGRAERIEIDSRPLAILLIKNPVGANEVFRTLVAEDERASADHTANHGLDLFIALNDRIADGRDVSWIWDADFELLAGHAGRVVCSGTRAAELALRLKYAGVSEDRIELVPPLGAGLDRSIVADHGRPLYALPTYTALIELRELLAERGQARPYWE